MERRAYGNQGRELLRELIEFLKGKELDCGQALITLRDAQDYVERASLRNPL